MPLPSVPDSFYWTTEPWGTALRCRPLNDLAPHLFTSRQPALSSQTDYEQLARGVGVDRVVTLTQVHGAAVTVVHPGAELPRSPPEADVLVSSVRPGGSAQGGESLPLEEVSFNAGRIDLTYVATDHKTGKAAGNVTAWWSQVENKGG